MKLKLSYLIITTLTVTSLLNSSFAQTNRDAHRRLSPVLSSLEAGTLRSGELVNISFSIMSYVEVQALVETRCLRPDGSSVVNANWGSATGSRNGYSWNSAQALNRDFSIPLTIAGGLSNQLCDMRFFYREPPNTSSTSNAVWLSTLIPAGVSSLTVGVEGRKTRRFLQGGGSSSTTGSRNWGGAVSTPDSLTREQVQDRLSPVIFGIDLPTTFSAGSQALLEWDVLSYNENLKSAAQIKCGTLVTSTRGDVVRTRPGTYSWGDHTSETYTFRGQISVPNVSNPSDCELRFFSGSDPGRSYLDDSSLLSVLIPSGHGNEIGTEGRKLSIRVDPVGQVIPSYPCEVIDSQEEAQQWINRLGSEIPEFATQISVRFNSPNEYCDAGITTSNVISCPSSWLGDSWMTSKLLAHELAHFSKPNGNITWSPSSSEIQASLAEELFFPSSCSGGTYRFTDTRGVERSAAAILEGLQNQGASYDEIWQFISGEANLLDSCSLSAFGVLITELYASQRF